MSQPPTLREQIDACRPGSNDLSLPELAGLAQEAERDAAIAAELGRSQRFDQSVAAALHDVPVPAGVLERLLEATSRAAVSTAEPDVTAVPNEPMAETRRLPSRRTWLKGALAVAAMALVAVATAIYWPRPVRQVSADQLAEMASRWADEAANAQKWATVPPAPALPLQASFPGAPLTNSARLRTAEGWSGTVYQGKLPGRRSFFVFDLATPGTQVGVNSIPFTKLPGSRYLIGAWQSNGRLYVVVIPRDAGISLEQLIVRKRMA